MGERAGIRQEEGLPRGIGRHFSSPSLPVREAVIAPDVEHLVERSDLGHETSKQPAQVPQLNVQCIAFVSREVVAHFSVREGIGSMFDDHCVHRCAESKAHRFETGRITAHTVGLGRR